MEKAGEALAQVGLADKAEALVSTLSGGEKQKVSLARCLAQKARLLLLDEPTANLDKENRQMVIDILYSLSISEIPTIIMVTHDKELTSLKKWEVLNLG
jgi:zinc transport system ATP-binding protein